MTPAEYLRRWRLDLAAHRLRTSDRPVAAVARSVGYTSEFAFTRAFARHQGQPPARYRSHSRLLAGRPHMQPVDTRREGITDTR